MSITPQQVTAARKLLGWSQMELSLTAGVDLSTVAIFEVGRTRPIEQTLLALRKALESGGVEFTEAGITLRNEKAGP